MIEDQTWPKRKFRVQQTRNVQVRLLTSVLVQVVAIPKEKPLYLEAKPTLAFKPPVTPATTAKTSSSLPEQTP